MQQTNVLLVLLRHHTSDLHHLYGFVLYFLGGSPLQVSRTLVPHWKLAKRHYGTNSVQVYSSDGVLKIGAWVLANCETQERMKKIVAVPMVENLQETAFHKLKKKVKINVLI